MSDTFLAPDDVEIAFPIVDHSLNKPLWLVGVNFFPRKQVLLTEWSGPEMTGTFGEWIKLFTGVSYLSKQGFNFGPKRGFYIAEMANHDLVSQHTRKLNVNAIHSDQLIAPGAKSTLLIGTFLGPSGWPFIQSPVVGGRSAKMGGGAAASVGILLQHVQSELGSNNAILQNLIYEFTAFCQDDRSPFTDVTASHTVPLALTEAVTELDWVEISTQSGVVPESMFDDPALGNSTGESPLPAASTADPEIKAHIEAGIESSRQMFLDGDEFDIRAFAKDLLEGAPSASIELVRDHALQNGRSIDELVEAEFARHWIGLDMAERDAELVRLIRFNNGFAQAELDSNEDNGQIDLIAATLNTKVLVLSTAMDAQYLTEFQLALADDPLVFGVHELGK